MAKHGKMTLDDLEATLNVIGGIENARRLRAGQLIIVDGLTLKPVIVSAKQLPTLKTVTLKVLDKRGVDELCIVLKEEGNGVSENAEDFFKRVPLIEEKMELELVAVTPADLGLDADAAVGQVYKGAKNLGLDLCPAQTGPELRRVYRDQPKGTAFIIAMDPVENTYEKPTVFCLICGDDGTRSLFGVSADLNQKASHAGASFVFARRK